MGCGAENSKKKCAIVKDIPEFKRGKIDILLQPILTFIRWCYFLIKILRGPAGWGGGGISIKAHLQNYLKICVAVIFIVHIGFQSLRKESFIFNPTPTLSQLQPTRLFFALFVCPKEKFLTSQIKRAALPTICQLISHSNILA